MAIKVLLKDKSEIIVPAAEWLTVSSMGDIFAVDKAGKTVGQFEWYTVIGWHKIVDDTE